MKQSATKFCCIAMIKFGVPRRWGTIVMVSLLLVGCQKSRDPAESAVLGSHSRNVMADPATPKQAPSLIADDIEIEPSPSAETAVVRSARFEELAPKCGIDFTYRNGAESKSLMVEATGGGCGWLDYDSDGAPDLYLVQGGDPTLPASPSQPANRLYRNLGENRFQNVAPSSGVDGHGYGQGVAVGDYDNDGFDDIFVTNVGLDVLYHNEGDGTFTKVETQLFPQQAVWSSSAAWGDIDRDGDLDLYVAHYVIYDPFHPKYCRRKSGKLGTCHPKEVDPCPDEFYLNAGDGTFRPAARDLGLYGSGNRGLGIAIADFDNDGWPDIYVANDTTANFLFINRQGRMFQNKARLLGCAVNGNGSPQASMGVAVADYDRNGYLDLYVTHYNKEWNTLYQNLGPYGFHDQTAATQLAGPTMEKLGFGTVIEDFDQDGSPELFVANGHIDDVRDYGVEFKMSPQYFSYNGESWVECSQAAGPFFQNKYLGRAVATADYDDDGDLDVAFVPQNARTVILQNVSRRGHWLKLRFVGLASNRRGIGTRVTVHCHNGSFVQELAGGTSYCASHQPVLVFGFGELAGPYDLEVRWPTGTKQIITNVRADQSLVLHETE